MHEACQYGKAGFAQRGLACGAPCLGNRGACALAECFRHRLGEPDRSRRSSARQNPHRFHSRRCAFGRRADAAGSGCLGCCPAGPRGLPRTPGRTSPAECRIASNHADARAVGFCRMRWMAPQPLTAEHALDAFESGVRSLGHVAQTSRARQSAQRCVAYLRRTQAR